MDIGYNDPSGKKTGNINSLVRLFDIDRIRASPVRPHAPREHDEIIVSVKVEGTTFVAVYGVVEGIVELISADLGEGRTVLAGRPAHAAARDLLRNMARHEMSRTEIPFMPDYRLTPRPPATSVKKDPWWVLLGPTPRPAD